ncbi:MAG: mediator complex subunit [Trizodia sp. TS-e1964]|nr:MAG: mediator complex subunit [Trizodia sp. TS-e1964]
MPSSSIVFSCAAAFIPLVVVAMPWNGAQPTPIAMSEPDALGWTPMPTGMVPAAQLFKRDSPAYLCGYVDGNPTDSVYCSSTYSCIFNTDIKAVGCCTANQYDCPFYTACYNSADIKASSCGSSCLSNSYIRKCTFDAYPSCYTYTYQANGYINVGCGTRAYSSNVLATFSGQSATSFKYLTSVSIATTVVTSVVTAPVSTSFSVVGPVESGAVVVSSSSGSSTNIAAIVGSAFGGVAVLTLIAALIFFLIYLKRKKAKEQPPVTQGAAGPGPPSAPGPGISLHGMPPNQNYPNQGYPQHGGPKDPYSAGGMDPKNNGAYQHQYPQSPTSPDLPAYTYNEMDGASQKPNPHVQPASSHLPYQAPREIHEAPAN